MKKSGFRIILSLIMIVSMGMVFAGGQQEKSPTPAVESDYSDEEITSWDLKPGMPYSGAKIQALLHPSGQNNLLKKYLPEFTEMTGIEVEIEIIPYGDLYQKFTIEAVSGTSDYDVYISHYTWIPALSGYLEPLNSRIASDGIDLTRWSDAYIQTCTWDGEVYGLPLRTHPMLLFYRKDLYEKYGLNEPKTFEELQKNAKVITENEDMYGIALQYGKNAEQVVYPWLTYLWAYGAEMFDEDFKPAFNTAKGIAATKDYMKPILENGTAAPGSVSYSEYDANLSFTTGEAAMVYAFWWAYGNFQNPDSSDLTVDQIGFCNVPGINGNQVSYAMSMPLSVTSFSDEKDASWEFVKWANSAKMDLRAVTDKSDPKMLTSVAAQFATLRNPKVNELNNGLHNVAATVLETAQTQPSFPEWVQVAEKVVLALNNIAAGEASVENALAKAENEVTEIMTRAGYYK